MAEPAILHPVTTAAQRLGIGRTSVYALMGTGQLRSVKIGKRRLVPESAITEYVAHLEQRSNSASYVSNP